MSEQEAVMLLLSLGYTITKPTPYFRDVWPTPAPDCRFCGKRGGHPYGDTCHGLRGTSVGVNPRG